MPVTAPVESKIVVVTDAVAAVVTVPVAVSRHHRLGSFLQYEARGGLGDTTAMPRVIRRAILQRIPFESLEGARMELAKGWRVA